MTSHEAMYISLLVGFYFILFFHFLCSFGWSNETASHQTKCGPFGLVRVLHSFRMRKKISEKQRKVSGANKIKTTFLCIFAWSFLYLNVSLFLCRRMEATRRRPNVLAGWSDGDEFNIMEDKVGCSLRRIHEFWSERVAGVLTYSF